MHILLEGWLLPLVDALSQPWDFCGVASIKYEKKLLIYNGQTPWFLSWTNPSTKKTLSLTAAQSKKECRTTSSRLPTYSIVATKMIKEPATAEDGDRFFPTSPGPWSILS